MTDALAIAGLIQSFKTMTDLGKAMLGMRDAALLREKAIELNGEILSALHSAYAAQTDQFTLRDRVRDLEKEIADLEAWGAKRQTYKLTKLSQWTNVLGYTLKEKRDSAEPDHFLCANCFNDRVESILQPETRSGLAEVLFCPRCKTDLYTRGSPSLAPPRSRR